MSWKIAALALAGLCFAAGAQARITEIRIDSTEPFAEGHAFGASGAYVRLKGVAKGELDPLSPQNSVIVDLDKVPRDARGMIQYEVDIFILRPADPTKGSGILFYEVLNRGNKQLGTRLLDVVGGGPAALNDPKMRAHAGNGFAFERGYTVVWSAWDPGVSSSNFRMTARFPTALENGKLLVRRVREEFQVGKRVRADVEVARLNYPAATTDRSKARLTMRLRASDARIEIPADRWEFADARSIRLLPRGTKFMPVAIYELWYEATQPKVVGLGYAAVRDVVSFLRNERIDEKGVANPLRERGGAVRHTLAFGGSQSGRFLRHFIELGMNKDLRGRKVFDGVYAHTAGAGKVFANHSFAQPSRTGTQHEDHAYPENWFPFSTASTTDPFSRRTASLMRGDGFDPLMIETNTSTEYWQKAGSLLTTDPAGIRDLALPPNSRVYMIAGTQHGGRAGLKSAAGICANPSNAHSPTPAMRALVVALDEWMTKGVTPPPSQVPSIAARTAVEYRAVRMPRVNGFTVTPGGNRIGPPVDWIDPPASSNGGSNGEGYYGTRVSAVDDDGNEVSGIRLPSIAVPMATYTGWNVYRQVPSELCDRDGSQVPFARTKAERLTANDPRLSIEERYGSRDGYVAEVRAVVEALIRDRLLLRADGNAFIRAAETSDRF
ncbi:MAG: alpha/beta hydrolase domain-containing protein [Xanthobacteraceae bacterium]